MDLKNGMANHKMGWSLDFTTNALNKWNNEVFGISQTQIQSLEKDLENLQRMGNTNKGKEKELMDQLNIQRSRLKSIYRYKARETWLMQRD